MNALYNFSGTSNRCDFLMTLFVGLISYFFLEYCLNSYISNWFLLIPITIASLPAVIRRLRDGGIHWYWSVLSLFSFISFGLSIYILEYLIPDEIVKNSIFPITLLSLIVPPLIASSLIYLTIRENFIRIFIVLTPVLAQLWLVYLLIFKKSESPNRNEVKIISKFKAIYLSIEGRISRGDFWFYGIAPMLLLSIFLSSIYIDYIFIDYEYMDLVKVLMTIVTFVFSIPFFILLIKRLHDLNKSAWWLLLLLIPFIGAVYVAFVAAFSRGTKDNCYGCQGGVDDAYIVYQSASKVLNDFIGKCEFKNIYFVSILIVLVTFIYNISPLFGLSPFKSPSWIVQSMFGFLVVCCTSVICLYLVNNKNNIGMVVIGFSIFMIILIFTFFIPENSKSLFVNVFYVLNVAFELLLILAVLIYLQIKKSYGNIGILGLIVVSYAAFFALSKMYSAYSFYVLFERTGYESMFLVGAYLNFSQSIFVFVICAYLMVFNRSKCYLPV